MSRSIFDPTGPNTEHSGSTFMGADAADHSHMPPDIVDGAVDADDAEELDTQTGNVPFNGSGEPLGRDGTSTTSREVVPISGKSKQSNPGREP